MELSSLAETVRSEIFHARKTEQCGVILFGTEGTSPKRNDILDTNLIGNYFLPDTQNLVNESNGGYEHVTEFIPIGQPNAQTMNKIKSIKPSTAVGDRQSDSLFTEPDVIIHVLYQQSTLSLLESKLRPNILQRNPLGPVEWSS